MPRTSRTRQPGEWHHVVNRGARRLPIFGDDDDHEFFLNLLAKAVRRSGIEVHAYALMPNHYHLLVRAEVGTLAVAMQVLGGEYTRRFNVKYGLDGALFRGRYRSVAVESEQHLASTVRYIHRNAPRSDPPRLSDFRWTSHLAHSRLARAPQWLAQSLVEQLFAGDTTRLRRFVEGPSIADDPPSATALEGASDPRVLDAADVEQALGVESEPERRLLQQGGRGLRNRQRTACVLLCQEFTDLTTAALAERYGYGSASSVRTAAQRGRALAESDLSFATTLDAARRRLSPARPVKVGRGSDPGVST
ncbi:MAG: transposase [Acidimicrobiales bacterium]|nr:transposase [Acidimicrobiales bacterium]